MLIITCIVLLLVILTGTNSIFFTGTNFFAGTVGVSSTLAAVCIGILGEDVVVVVVLVTIGIVGFVSTALHGLGGVIV